VPLWPGISKLPKKLAHGNIHHGRPLRARCDLATNNVPDLLLRQKCGWGLTPVMMACSNRSGPQVFAAMEIVLDVLCAEADCSDAASELRAAVRDKNALSDRSS